MKSVGTEFSRRTILHAPQSDKRMLRPVSNTVATHLRCLLPVFSSAADVRRMHQVTHVLNRLHGMQGELCHEAKTALDSGKATVLHSHFDFGLRTMFRQHTKPRLDLSQVIDYRSVSVCGQLHALLHSAL